MAGLSLSGITKSFGAVPVLHGIDLGVADGEFVVLVGPSGCGKSTLLRLLAGLETITAGEFRMDGRLMNAVPPADRGIGMVFQSYALYPHMTVAENMSFGLRLKRAPRAEIDAQVRATAATLQLDGLLDRKPRNLSGGQRQRVAIGRALIQKPEIFLFDEPLSNLDAKLRITMRVEIARLHRQLNATSIYVTHDQVEALTLADKIVIMNGGRIEQVGRPLDLYHRPASLFVASFIGSPEMNLFSGRLESVDKNEARVVMRGDGTVGAGVDARGLELGQPVTLGIRPESIRLGLEENALRGRVEIIEHLGESTLLHLSVPAREDLVVVKVEGSAASREGETVSFGFRASDAYLFGPDGRSMHRHKISFG
jgi:multiple sugar transport system ATP-binding protein